MSNLTIIFDMDGTINNFYDIPDWLSKIRDYNTAPYLEAKPKWDMDKLNSLLLACIEKGIEVKICSWCSKESNKNFDNATRQAKLQWLRKYNIPYTTYRITHYGYPKEYCRNRKRHNILVDDNAKIRERFCRFDHCEAIDPNEVNIIEWLEKLLAE